MSVETNDQSVRDFFQHNIFIFCDGTWCGEGTGTRTNVKLIYDFVTKTCSADSSHAKYCEGLGLGNRSSSEELRYLTGGALAVDFKQACCEVYQHIVEHFNPGDKIWLFGLSRGAFTIRCVAGMINNLGILKRDGNANDVHIRSQCLHVFDLYQCPLSDWGPKGKACKQFKEARSHKLDYPPVLFMGLFDTVGALGAPDHFGERFPFKLYDTKVSRSVQNVYQCASIHDRLFFFQPCSIERNRRFPDGHKYHLEEVWVPGCHYDVGRQHFKFGVGFLSWPVVSTVLSLLRLGPPEILPNHSYADLALDWMIGKMVDHHFPNPSTYPNVTEETQKNPPANNHRWEGDVYDRLLDYYHVSKLKPYFLGDRILPRDIKMVPFGLVPENYQSRALTDNHKFFYPDAEPEVVQLQNFNIYQKIPQDEGLFVKFIKSLENDISERWRVLHEHPQ